MKENVNPDVDRLMDRLGLKFWVTREYKPAADRWSSDEQREGLNRTYRMILQNDYALPPNLVNWLPSALNQFFKPAESLLSLRIPDRPLGF